MAQAIDETNRRRAKQTQYNLEHGIEPMSIVKAIRDITDQVAAHAIAETAGEYRPAAPLQMPKDELSRLVKELEKQMRAAAEGLEFEKAAGLRDQIFELRQALADMEDLPPLQRARVLSGDR
jgi:excinuclease ABC subunit B